MISKRTRRAGTPIEPLKQFQIGITKGIDTTRNADDPNSVVDMTNFDLTSSGDAELRKPAVRLGSFSCADGEVLKVLPLYRTGYFLKVTRVDGAVRAEIVDESDTPQDYKLVWYDYYTEEEHSAGFQGANYTPMTFASWGTAKSVDTNTTTLILNTKVRLDAEVFGTPETIYDPNLYADIADKSFPRTIQLYWSDVDVCWIVKVVTPTVNTLNTAESGELGLDANMALDNPYAIRDIYNSSAPTVKNILPYAYSYLTSTGNVVVSPTALASNPVSHVGTYNTPHGSVPNNLDSQILSWKISPKDNTPTDPANTSYAVDISLIVNTLSPINIRTIYELQLPTKLVEHVPIFASGGSNSTTAGISLYLVSITDVSLTDVTFVAENLSVIHAQGVLTRTFIQSQYNRVGTWNYAYLAYDYGIAYIGPESGFRVPGIQSDTDVMYPPSIYMLCYMCEDVLLNTTTGSYRDWVGNPTYAGISNNERAKRNYRSVPSSFSDPVYDNRKTVLTVGSFPNSISMYCVGTQGGRHTVYTLGFPLYDGYADALPNPTTTLVHGHLGYSRLVENTYRVKFNNRPNKRVLNFPVSVWEDADYASATHDYSGTGIDFHTWF